MDLRPFTALFLLLLTFIRAQDDDLKSQINAAVETYSNYVLPTDNSAFFEKVLEDSTPKENGTYDFVIVGGGTAGGVLSARLTAANFRVLLLEAGKFNPTIVPSMVGLSAMLYRSEYNWGYNTTPQTNACFANANHQCFYPTGKILGGSVEINAGMYVRGNRHDFDRWQALGGSGWAYEDVLPYFKKAESAHFERDIQWDYHGFDGPQVVDVADDFTNFTEFLLGAFNDLNRSVSDYNGATQYGVGRLQYYIDKNVRSGVYRGYIEPSLNRTNFYISLESFVTKVLIDNGTAYGVEYVHNGTLYRAEASKEVILSAGVLNTPQILMLSGIGPKEQLKDLDIEVVQDLPVGQYLQDHLNFMGIYYRVNEVPTYNNNTIDDNLELWKNGKGPYAFMSPSQVISFFDFDDEDADDTQPDIEIFVSAASSAIASGFLFTEEYKKSFEAINSMTDFLVNLVLLHPKSKGNVTLKSNDPRDYPQVNTNYLSEEDDLATMYKGIQKIIALNQTDSFKKWEAEFHVIEVPNCDQYVILTRDWWYCSLRSISVTIFHPIGTTRMGSTPNDSVVDSELKVHGLKGLRVVDAGVIPAHVSGHIEASVVMIAEKAADAIIKEYRSFFCKMRKT